MAAGGSPGSREIFQVFMVCVDLNRMCRSLEVHPPLFERCHHRQQFLIVDRVVQFCRCELARIETDWVQVAVHRGLGQNAAECEVGGVCFDGQGLGRLKVSQNWSSCEGVLQSSESLLRC